MELLGQIQNFLVKAGWQYSFLISFLDLSPHFLLDMLQTFYHGININPEPITTEILLQTNELNSRLGLILSLPTKRNIDLTLHG